MLPDTPQRASRIVQLDFVDELMQGQNLSPAHYQALLEQQTHMLLQEREHLREVIRLQRSINHQLKTFVVDRANEPCCDTPGCRWDTPMCVKQLAKQTLIMIQHQEDEARKVFEKRGTL